MCTPSETSIAWGDVITWSIIIIGWGIAINSQKKNETRKEVYSTLQDIYKSLLKINDCAIKFHTDKKFDGQILFNILSNQQRTYNDIKRLTNVLELDHKELDVKNYNLRKSISLKNADSSTFKTLSSNDDILKSICESHDNLADFLQDTYYKRYF